MTTTKKSAARSTRKTTRKATPKATGATLQTALLSGIDLAISDCESASNGRKPTTSSQFQTAKRNAPSESAFDAAIANVPSLADLDFETIARSGAVYSLKKLHNWVRAMAVDSTLMVETVADLKYCAYMARVISGQIESQSQWLVQTNGDSVKLFKSREFADQMARDLNVGTQTFSTQFSSSATLWHSLGFARADRLGVTVDKSNPIFQKMVELSTF